MSRGKLLDSNRKKGKQYSTPQKGRTYIFEQKVRIFVVLFLFYGLLTRRAQIRFHDQMFVIMHSY